MGDPSSTDHFSPSYAVARAKFLGAARAAEGELIHLENASKGADGECLFTDIALLGPRSANSVLVVCSGTHGVEGFCGSGIQTGLLREGVAQRLPPDVRLVLVHALNPYGFSHIRRVNEDNVDLNRNFVSHDTGYPENPAYDALYDAINPQAGSGLARVAALARLLTLSMIKGRRTLKSAIAGGQYTHPSGLFYGGSCETWSNKALQEIVARCLSSSKRVAFVDIHTGLGPYGECTLISRFPGDSPVFERISTWWGSRATPAVTSKVAAANLTGSITMAFSAMLPTAETTPVTVEFGTVGQLKLLRAMQAENWQHHNGTPHHPTFRRAKVEMKRAYYPETTDWMQRVWEQGKEIIDRALKGLSTIDEAGG